MSIFAESNVVRYIAAGYFVAKYIFANVKVVKNFSCGSHFCGFSVTWSIVQCPFLRSEIVASSIVI